MNKKITALSVLTVAGAVCGALSLLSFPLKTVRYRVYSPKINKPVRIVQLSDLHNTSYGRDMKVLKKAVDAAAPDIVIMTGDIYSEKSDNENVTELLRYLGNRYKCFYAAGNHELRNDRWKERFKPQAESLGITVLEGQTVLTDGIAVCGAAKAADGSLYWDEAVEKCAGDVKYRDEFAVLLDHFPEDIGRYRSFGCFDLVFSGHAHGGQWRIPKLLNGIYAPGQGLFPRYAGGRYDFDGCTMIVSRGLDRTKLFLARMFNNPEVVVADLLSEEKNEQS